MIGFWSACLKGINFTSALVLFLVQMVCGLLTAGMSLIGVVFGVIGTLIGLGAALVALAPFALIVFVLFSLFA